MREFIKGVSAGNDYIYVYGKPCRKNRITRACNRRDGIGGDGVVFYEKIGDREYAFRIFNADGSEAEFCGNACLTLAKILFSAGGCKKNNLRQSDLKNTALNDNIAGKNIKSFVFFTKAGKCEVETNGRKTSLIVPAPLRKKSEFASSVCGKSFKKIKVFSAGVFDSGNLHLAVRAEKADKGLANAIAACAKRCEEFPSGVNVEIFSLNERGACAVVKERGSGFTGSCGSGALCVYSLFEECASAKNGLKIAFEGGCLSVIRKDEKLLLSGCPEIVYMGKSEGLL